MSDLVESNPFMFCTSHLDMENCSGNTYIECFVFFVGCWHCDVVYRFTCWWLLLGGARCWL